MGKDQTPGRQQPLMPGFEQRIETANVLNNSSYNSGRTINVLQDGLAFMSFGAQALAQDEFSKCFVQKERSKLSLNPWPVLSFAIRYFILFPIRLTSLLSASLIFFALLPLVLALDREDLQRWLFKLYCQAFLFSWGARIKHNSRKPKLDVPHLFVANHTSVIDYIVLSAHDFPHATIAQTHGGLLGMFEHSVLVLNGSLMFNRNEKNDRKLISSKMRKHVHNTKNVPLLIFPEGTCVNNEYTVLFNKGAFELDAAIVPCAVKYDKQWADAYWHSKTQTFTYHILYLMTRWALVAEVSYLPPQTLQTGQTSTDFANNVKALISKQAKLKNLSWDGYFKNFLPTEEKQQRLKETPQSRYGALLTNRMRMRLGAYHTSQQGKARRRPGRSNSFCMGDMPVWHASDRRSIEQPEWLASNNSTDKRNEILVRLMDEDGSNEMIQKISEKKTAVVDVWKRYTKDKSGDQQRRIENSSWRLWFKQRIEHEARKQQQREATTGTTFLDGIRSPKSHMDSLTSPILGPVLGNAYNLMSQLIGLGLGDSDEENERELRHDEGGRRERVKPLISARVPQRATFDELRKDFPKIKTLHDVFQSGLKINPKGNCLGHRPTFYDPETKTMLAKDYVWQTYEEVKEERINSFAYGIVKLYKDEKFRLGVYSNIFGFKMPLTRSGHVIIMDGNLSKTPNLKVALELGKQSLRDRGVKLYFSEVEALGKKNIVAPRLPNPEDPAVISYTSGTTGTPKDAILLHKNIVAYIRSHYDVGIAPFYPTDVHMSYLPLAYIYEKET
ncbi:UNVERIFIED_CONTAM: 1-acylglycerol-3-phosphate O-acyltransferase 6 (lysophosphatidic acid acyltransferase, zeta) [Siphonaria sp. JEL0065]|nr:1-acylglycerol-3-phosphate O-acyltransferase 6 (lysophosphatidic acid acyltransferase, zeta) [Siphonaria sp. JEL0065]